MVSFSRIRPCLLFGDSSEGSGLSRLAVIAGGAQMVMEDWNFSFRKQVKAVLNFGR